MKELEAAIGMPVWLVIQADDDQFDQIDDRLYKALFDARAEFGDKRIALLIDSPGGYAQHAFQIAGLIRRQCEAFTAIVPRYAKSAATLLAIGASEIIMQRDAELGPLDAQYLDFEREMQCSSLDEVQALERLHAFGLEALDKSVLVLKHRTRKRTETLLPSALSFVSELMRPLLEKIDTVHYSQMARQLKVAEEYASRLLQPAKSPEQAKKIARQLVHSYPEHAFVINPDEARSLGLNVVEPPTHVSEILDRMFAHLGTTTMVGKLQEVTT